MATDPSHEKPDETKAILERLEGGLQRFAVKFAKDLNDPRLKKKSATHSQLMFHLDAAGRPFMAILIPQPLPEEISSKDRLTAREEEVERQLLNGLTYEAIAKELDLKLGTVGSHV